MLPLAAVGTPPLIKLINTFIRRVYNRYSLATLRAKPLGLLATVMWVLPRPAPTRLFDDVLINTVFVLCVGLCALVLEAIL